MIQLQYTNGGGVITQLFPDTKSGNSACLKFIQELYKKRTEHPFYQHMKKIEKLEADFKNTRSRGKKKLQLEIDILFYKSERAELLEILGLLDEAPPLIKLEIEKV